MLELSGKRIFFRLKIVGNEFLQKKSSAIFFFTNFWQQTYQKTTTLLPVSSFSGQALTPPPLSGPATKKKLFLAASLRQPCLISDILFPKYQTVLG